MRRTIPILAAAVAGATGCGGQESSSPPPATTTAEVRPGDAGVYAKIARSRDCASLQETFTRAADNNERYSPGTYLFDVTSGYMDASNARMEEVGCYG